MPRIEPTARIANGGAMRAAASISIAPAPNISASRSEICSDHSPDAQSDQLRPSEDLFLFSYMGFSVQSHSTGQRRERRKAPVAPLGLSSPPLFPAACGIRGGLRSW